ncbi:MULTISPECIES: head-tail adaptor protein [Tabrizicola]|uniref:head-tail adaptor protein n=1 Tax=Tabrizicola TaxID=1443919 RepID=UPI0010802F2B|nr:MULTISPECIES: head-tail adaptor protein [Paracoccaceae]
MNAPHLNRLLVLEAVERTPDGAGGFSSVWTALGTLWAEVMPGQGGDLPGEERMMSAVPCRITVRAAPAGSPSRPIAGQRFREGTRLFLIQAVAERDRSGRYLTCFGREEVQR